MENDMPETISTPFVVDKNLPKCKYRANDYCLISLRHRNLKKCKTCKLHFSV